MKKMIVGLSIVTSCLIGIAWASSVTTTDGKNFLVTNDAGFAANYTNQEISQKVDSYDIQTSADAQRYQADQEQYIVWQGVQQMELNATAVYENQT